MNDCVERRVVNEWPKERWGPRDGKEIRVEIKEHSWKVMLKFSLNAN